MVMQWPCDRDIASCHQRTNARFEFLKLSRLRSRSFRKNDEHVAGVREQLPADREAVPDVRLAREWQRVHDHGCDPGARHAFEKIIGGGGGKGAMQSAKRQTREQANGIEMAGVIRDENKRAIIAQILFANDLEEITHVCDGCGSELSRTARLPAKPHGQASV